MAEEAVKALKVLKAISKDTVSFYDRDRELNELLDMVEKRVERIVVVLGPNNAGKSMVLKRMGELFSNPVLKAVYPLFRIDMRLSDYRTPGLAATAIVKVLRTWSVWFKEAAIAIFKSKVGGNVTVDVSEIAKFVEGVPDGNLAAVMSAFQRLAYASPDVRPIFIMDEADKLKMWPAEETKILLDGFVAMTKQDERATVILSSSDDLFRDWFRSHVNSHQWKAVGVGYFNEQSARCFFSRLLPSTTGVGAVFGDDEWNRIFKVCGGNPLALKGCATDVYKLENELDDVLEGMVESFNDTILAGVSATLEKDGWSGDKFEEVMKLIVKHGAVGLSELESQVFGLDRKNAEMKARADSRSQMRAMLKENMIHVRFVPKSVRYDDFQRDAGSKDTDYVMATAPAHFVAMERYVAATSTSKVWL